MSCTETRCRQRNGFDCGVFALLCLSRLVASAPNDDVRQENMPSFRIHIAAELADFMHDASTAANATITDSAAIAADTATTAAARAAKPTTAATTTDACAAVAHARRNALRSGAHAPAAANRQTGIRRSSRGEMEEEAQAELMAKVSLLEMRLQEEKEHDELLHHHRRLEVQRAYERRKNEELTATIAFLEAKVEKLAAGPTRADKAIDSEPTMSVRVAELAAHVVDLEVKTPVILPEMYLARAAGEARRFQAVSNTVSY
ncbi:hypothetical protein AB1Y20_001398 [Prymnesium parvum]|uniref:Ubiquitin-like protease family profile domain-containing protein n=1 Tax=Prymnesium parvum TaxID=97485 RepID=A0AB34KAS3_PRYPA